MGFCFVPWVMISRKSASTGIEGPPGVWYWWSTGVKSQYCVIYYKEYCKIFQVLGDKIKDSKICKNTLTKKEKQEDFI